MSSLKRLAKQMMTQNVDIGFFPDPTIDELLKVNKMCAVFSCGNCDYETVYIYGHQNNVVQCVECDEFICIFGDEEQV